VAGGIGNDIYHFRANFDSVSVRDAGGAHDVIEFEDQPELRLGLARSGANLRQPAITLGDTASVTVADWYAGTAFQIEEFRVGGYSIAASDINQLVAAGGSWMHDLPRKPI